MVTKCLLFHYIEGFFQWFVKIIVSFPALEHFTSYWIELKFSKPLSFRVSWMCHLKLKQDILVSCIFLVHMQEFLNVLPFLASDFRHPKQEISVCSLICMLCTLWSLSLLKKIFWRSSFRWSILESCLITSILMRKEPNTAKMSYWAGLDLNPCLKKTPQLIFIFHLPFHLLPCFC